MAALCGVALLVGLGTWQLQRLHWKQALIAGIEARRAAPAMTLPQQIDDPAALEHSRVLVRGRFLHERELYLGPRTRKGAVGFHVVTPLLLEDGRSLLVDRGWVPSERRDPATRPAGQVSGRVRLEGAVRRPGWKGSALFRPDNDAAANYWFWVDIPAMAAAAGLAEPVVPIYVEAEAAEVPGGLPAVAGGRVELRNDHLEYALTWYALAAVLVVIYLLFHLRRAPGPRPAARP